MVPVEDLIDMGGLYGTPDKYSAYQTLSGALSREVNSVAQYLPVEPRGAASGDF